MEILNATDTITLADRITLPAHTEAILWDMDGVLLDTLGLAYTLSNQLVQTQFGAHVSLEREFIRSIFAYDTVLFWQLILDRVGQQFGIAEAQQHHQTLLDGYHEQRHDTVFDVLIGVKEILKAAKEQGIKNAVVSNNPSKAVHTILERAGIRTYFDTIVGNDVANLQKKPAPDTYLFGASQLSIAPTHCVVVEDSLLGAEAGRRAGCYVIGVETGGTTAAELEKSGFVDRVYSSFQPHVLHMQFGNVTQKKLLTPNDFVSHMIEHIAWRLGCSIDLKWYNTDWKALGQVVGAYIHQHFEPHETVACVLGMIDDGSAEVKVDLSDTPTLNFESTSQINLDWFLSLRVEQVAAGHQLVELLKGLVEGLPMNLSVLVCSLEDPHHTWEGIFRSVGIALNKIFTPVQTHRFSDDRILQQSEGDVVVLAKSASFAEVCRRTAETSICVKVDFTKSQTSWCNFQVASSIQVVPLEQLILKVAEAMDCSIQVDFNAVMLSSSHVVAEDIGLVLGRTLKEILVERMMTAGVNGAGSSIDSLQTFEDDPIRVGISVEGRKFWKFVPFDTSFQIVKEQLLIGHTVREVLFSEDLDDFIDGLSGGLGGSIMIHIKELIAPNEAWPLIFTNIGKALKEVFSYNPYRKGVPPGVKATLA